MSTMAEPVAQKAMYVQHKDTKEICTTNLITIHLYHSPEKHTIDKISLSK